MFEPLSDPAYFARVELDDGLGSIRCPSGADIAPETLHLWLARERDDASG